jgi:hypothetical protein
VTIDTSDWDRAIVKAAEAIWSRLFTTGREDRIFSDLDQDTFDDLCIQARAAIEAWRQCNGVRR